MWIVAPAASLAAAAVSEKVGSTYLSSSAFHSVLLLRFMLNLLLVNFDTIIEYWTILTILGFPTKLWCAPSAINSSVFIKSLSILSSINFISHAQNKRSIDKACDVWCSAIRPPLLGCIYVCLCVCVVNRSSIGHTVDDSGTNSHAHLTSHCIIIVTCCYGCTSTPYDGVNISFRRFGQSDGGSCYRDSDSCTHDFSNRRRHTRTRTLFLPSISVTSYVRRMMATSTTTTSTIVPFTFVPFLLPNHQRRRRRLAQIYHPYFCFQFRSVARMYHE